MILAGDIGGTKTNLGLFEVGAGRLQSVRSGSFPSRRYGGLEEVLEEFLPSPRPRLEAACFGIAGPVIHERVRPTNLPWVVEAARLAPFLGTPRVRLLNDLAATAHGLLALGPGDLHVLQEGDPTAGGNRALIAAGTGLGEAFLTEIEGEHYPSASEGGHADFAPRNAVERELWAFLMARYGRAEYERVVSGPGLANIHRFLSERGEGEESHDVPEEAEGQDAGTFITRQALEGGCGRCRMALDLFVEIWGAEAGNLALKVLATGGVYLGGGIAPRILPVLSEGRFLAAFTDKGALAEVMKAIPVRVILNDRTGLLGAARCAAREAGALTQNPSLRNTSSHISSSS